MVQAAHLNRYRLLVVFLVLLIVLLGGGLSVTYLQKADLQSRLTKFQDEANAYYTQLQTSQTQNSQLQSQITQLQSQNTYLANQVQSLNLQASHPTLGLWNTCGGAPCYMRPTAWREGGVPDTFTYYPRFTSDYPVGLYILTLSQYVQFVNCPSNGYVESKINCVSGTYSYYSPTTSLNGVFHLAEGCSSYVSIYYSNYVGVMRPNETVTYNPSPTSTGVCG